MYIYVDVLIIVNCYICFIILMLTKAVLHISVKKKNIIIATLIGGVSSLISLMSSEIPLHKMPLIFLKVLSIIIVVNIAFFDSSRKKLIIATSTFISLNALLAGCVYFINSLKPNNVIYLHNSSIYFNISAAQLVITTAMIYLFLTIISRIREKYASKSASYKVVFSFMSHQYVIPAIADTGNMARDIFTGKPVVICQGVKLYDDVCDVKAIPVPCSTVAGETLLYAITPDYIYITDEFNKCIEISALIADSTQENAEIRAIFNPDLLINEV